MFFMCTQIDERLVAAVNNGSYEDTLSCLRQGAKATYVSYSCARTAVGSAVLKQDSKILQLLIQSCEEPDSEIFHQDTKSEIEIETTPEGMDRLEWEDEFTANADQMNITSSNDDTIEELSSLYHYYARTFEQTGEIVSKFQNYCYDHNNCNNILHQDPHTLDHMAMAPLHYAAVRGDIECARILLEHGAKVDATTATGNTPLYLAANNANLTSLLLKHGANPNAKTFYTGKTPINAALKCRNAVVSQMLLQTNKVNLNDTDKNDKTLLMYAIIYDQTETALELVSRGAKINLQDKDGKTALFYAVESNNLVVAASLLQRGARQITNHYLLHQCVLFKMGDMDMFKLLLHYNDHKHGLTVCDTDGFTPMQLAIFYNRIEMIEYVLKLDTTSFQSEVKDFVLLAVQYVDDLNNFKRLVNVLHAYGGCSLWHKKIYSTTNAYSCYYTSFCDSPLSQAIYLQKLHIAEFLLKEGLDLQQQVCRYHMENYLRTLTVPGNKEFIKFLFLNGLKLSPQPITLSNADASPMQRQDFEEYIQQLRNQPLGLKALTRIKIRKHLIQTFCDSSLEFKHIYQATNQKSTIQKMIEKLEIPKLLQEFLIDFHDCESVIPLYN